MDDDKQLTGRTVLLVTLAAFGVVIGANMTLLWAAIGSFPGLEVKNSYVASQSFDTDRATQEALGWTASAAYAGGALTLTLTGPDGGAVVPAALAARIGRPTYAGEDRDLALAPSGAGFRAPADLAPGLWHLHLAAEATDGTAFRQRLVLTVPQS